MICTGNYSSTTDMYNRCSISGDRGKKIGYSGPYYSKLAPKKDFWLIYDGNIGKISEEENNKFYIIKYWEQVLSQLDPQTVYDELDNNILLCYETENQFCHRHIVAAWFELFLNVQISEVQYSANGLKFLKREDYYKDYLEIKKYLEQLIIDSMNIDIDYYTSINDWYLSKMSNKKIVQSTI